MIAAVKLTLTDYEAESLAGKNKGVLSVIISDVGWNNVKGFKAIFVEYCGFTNN